MTHRSLFLAAEAFGLRLGIGWLQECIPNKVFPNSEGELELSKATVPDGSNYSVVIRRV